MKRTILAVVAVLLAAPALFVSAAEACISCEYVPEVLNAKPAAKPYESKQRRYGAYERVQDYRKRAAGSARAARKVESAKAAPRKSRPESESKETEAAATDTKGTGPETAKAEATPGDKSADDEPKVAAKAGCTKYFPNVGMTVAVPCE